MAINFSLYHVAISADQQLTKACKDAGYRDRLALPSKHSEWPVNVMEAYQAKLDADNDWLAEMRRVS